MTKEEKSEIKYRMKRLARKFCRRNDVYRSFDGTVGELVEKSYLSAYLLCLHENKNKIAELEAQMEKLIDFVLSKTECCDVCPITDTCINSEGTCPYAEILAKGEKEVTRKWLMQFISKEIKENDSTNR